MTLPNKNKKSLPPATSQATATESSSLLAVNDQESELAQQPIIAHLVELRQRTLRSVIVIISCFLGLFYFSSEIYHLLAQPLMATLPAGSQMIATEVASPFLTPLKLTIVAAVFLSVPYLLHQLWAFISPGLYLNEKRFAIPLLLSSILLFYAGIAFAYFLVFPVIFAFFTSVAPEGVQVMTDIQQYFSFVIKLFFAFGLIFEVPVATFLLVASGLASVEKLGKARPYIFVGAFVAGMLLTPPDLLSQFMLAIPMWLLFELGLLLAKLSRVSAAKNAPSS
ncbi:MAG: twin-arginine translocase subunit TatC [Pseudomonadota bacterium]|nr:twin-arginine translocase subunit TatC [Pseudomonadota bacterium]